MAHGMDIEWKKVEDMVVDRFGEALDEQTILFIIGLQELGLNKMELKKEQKLDVIHIGICTVLSPYGYYKNIGRDNDGWPHFKNIQKLPDSTKGEEQKRLLRKAIVDYFNL